MLPFQIDGDLTVRVGGSTVRLTPSEGLQAAEQLIRKSTRRMMLDEALDAVEPDAFATRMNSVKDEPDASDA